MTTDFSDTEVSNVIPFPGRHLDVSPPARSEAEQELHHILKEVSESAEDDPLSQHDLSAIDNERVFLARFGFDCPQRLRKAVIEMKHGLDLTDREISLLEATGDLRFDKQSVRLAPSCWNAVFGYVQIAVHGLMMLLTWLVAMNAPFTPWLVPKLVCVLAVLLILVWGVHRSFVRPWNIYQRTRK